MCPMSVWIDTSGGVWRQGIVSSGPCPSFSTGVWGGVRGCGGCFGFARSRWTCF